LGTVNKDTLDHVSFSIDLLNLSGKLGGNESSGDGIAPDAIEKVEDALRAAGVREPLKKTK